MHQLAQTYLSGLNRGFLVEDRKVRRTDVDMDSLVQHLAYEDCIQH